MRLPAVHLTQSSDADVATVVSIGGDPARLPEWAASLSWGIRNGVSEEEFDRDAAAVRENLERLAGLTESASGRHIPIRGV